MAIAIKIEGYTVNIYHDDWAENPHSMGYTSHICMTDPECLFGGELLLQKGRTMEEVFLEHLSQKGLTTDDVIVEPLYLYVHSGVALKTSCPYVQGVHRGWIYEMRRDIAKEFGVQNISLELETKVRGRLSKEVEEIEHWANGSVYRFYIPELEFSLGSFFGFNHEASGLLEYARDVIEYDIRCKRKEHFKRLKRLIRGKVGLQYRPALSV